MTPLFSPAAMNLGVALGRDFMCQTRAVSKHDELRLFRAWMRSLVAVSARDWKAKEYHGSRYQVQHHPVAAVAHLGISQSELCDVMVLSFDKDGREPPRVTFLQAKLQRRKPSRCPAGPGKSFSADLVQWSLLAGRPRLLRTKGGTANFAADLLSSATLASVGSFGFFEGRAGGSVGFRYASADALVPVGRAGRTGRLLQRHEKLRGMFRPTVRHNRNGLRELKSACCLETFGAGLWSMLVGTPILPGSRLAHSVRSLVEAHRLEHPDDELLAGAFDQLPARNLEPEFTAGPRLHLLVLQSGNEFVGRPD